MPQDGSNNYHYPPGTPGIPDQTIESEAYNTFLDDLVVNDLNIPRPIHRGGTGANNANQALVNLTGENATQLVTDYDSQVWLPGSFYSATSATAAPVAGHAFAGIVYLNEPLVFPPTNANVTVEARDQSDTTVPGRVYVRQKKAGVWDTAWSVQAGSIADMDTAYVNVAGDTMTGLLTLSGNPTADFHASTKQYVDGGVAGIPGKVSKAGDTMTGLLTLSGDPTAIMHAATKQYVDGGVGGVGGGLTAKVDKAGGAGGIMTGLLTLSADPTAVLHAATKQYVDAANTATANAAVVAMADSGMQINGSMDISQVNGTSSVAIANGINYVIDGVKVEKTGTSALNAQQVVSVFSGFANELKFTVTTAQASIGGDYVIFEMPIEGYRFYRTMWGTASAIPVTVGFWVKSSVAGSILLQLHNSAATTFVTATPTITTANIAQYITATFAATTTGTWLNTNGIGAMLRINLAIAGSINIAATNGNTFEITGLVVLPGSQTITAAQSPLLMRPYDQELMTCGRYYQKVTVGIDFLASGGGETQAAQAAFVPRMRAVPSLVGSGTGQSANLSLNSFNRTTINGTGMQISSGAAGRAYFYDEILADARL